eukprot:NODE_38_length_30618_cov_0.377142.p7 type:complete len:369 gc:universal NODE_38_length_30618_cov_0.377142:6044-7150(+)
MSVADMNDAIIYLNQQFSDESSLYDHLVSSMRTILYERPAHPKKAFAILTDLKVTAKSSSAVESVAEQKNNDKIQELLQFVPKEERNVQDIGKLHYLLENAGIPMSLNESKLLAASIERLSENKSLNSSRFWGRLDIGADNHYYIVEADAEENQNSYDASVYDKLSSSPRPVAQNSQAFKPVPVEEHDGPNKYVYFACKFLYDEWLMLPEVIPYHITASRNQKLAFTGNLQSIVRGHPPFFGNESQLLRTQIARITASTTIAPVNFYILDEQDDQAKAEIILNPEYQPESAHEMSKLQNWMHTTSYLLPQGRCNWASTKAADVSKEEDDEQFTDSNVSNGEDDKVEVGPSLLSTIDQDDGNCNLFSSL